MWLWPIRVSTPIAVRTLNTVDRIGRLADRPLLWGIVCAIAGALPAIVFCLAEWPGQQIVTAVLLSPLLIAAAARDSLWAGLAAVGFAFCAHSAVVITLAASNPQSLATILPSGLAYWEQSRDWIETGTSPEYKLQWWLPAHFQLLAAVAIFTYTSLGLVSLWQGLYEVDLMNFYVGQLVANSHSPLLALAFGWHPWSVCRGLGYLLITFEVVSFSLERLTGRPLSTLARRRNRWLGGISFLVADGLIKYTCLESVRKILAENMI